MKKIVYLIITFLVVSSVVVAQAPRRGGEEGKKKIDSQTSADRLTERLVKEYSLTDEQKKQVSDANLIWVKQLDVIAQGNKKKEEQSREETKKAHDTYNAQLKKILTNEQYDAYITKEAASKAFRKGYAEGIKKLDPQTRAEHLTERLVKAYSLTDEQKKQVSDANLTLVKQLDVITQPNKDQQREDIKKVRDTYDAQLKGILTSEQYDAYTKNQSKQPNRPTGGGERGNRNRPQ